MPIVVDASESFDVAGRRYTERETLTGLPSHLLQRWYVRRAFRTVDDETGAQGTEWAVVEVTGRLARSNRQEETADGRQASVTEYRFLTNSGALTHLDELASEDGWWRLPARDGRETYQVVGDPYVALAGSAHHYEVTVRRVDG